MYRIPNKYQFGIVERESPLSLAEPKTGKYDWRRDGEIIAPYIRLTVDTLVVFTGDGSARESGGFQQCYIDGSDDLYWVHLGYCKLL